MICWRCGKKLTEHASSCVYCGTSQKRIVPKTEAGKAMRQIYDYFGPTEILTSKNKLSVGLGDMLSDSKKLRRQIEAAFEAGIGRFYLNQLDAAGKADVNFNTRIKKLLIENAEVSDKAAEDIMKYMEEMIGWQPAGVQSSHSHEKESSGSCLKSKEDIEFEQMMKKYREEKTRLDKLKEEQRKKDEEWKKRHEEEYRLYEEKMKENRRKVDPKKQEKASWRSEKKPVLPTEKIPENPATTYIIIGAILLVVSIVTFHPVAIIGMIVFMVLYFIAKPKGPNHIKIYNKGNGNYSCEWDMPLEKWAVAVGGKWIEAGEGKGKTVSFTCQKLPVDICICSIKENLKYPLTLEGKVTLNANNTMSE